MCWFCFCHCQLSAGRYLGRSISLKCQVKFKQESLSEVRYNCFFQWLDLTIFSATFLNSHTSTISLRTTYFSVILYWQNLEHSAIFYFRCKNCPSCRKCGIKFTICKERVENMYCPLVWRSCGRKVGLVPHSFLRSCKYHVLKYSDANMKMNCNLLQGFEMMVQVYWRVGEIFACL